MLPATTPFRPLDRCHQRLEVGHETHAERHVGALDRRLEAAFKTAERERAVAAAAADRRRYRRLAYALLVVVVIGGLLVWLMIV